MSKTQGKRRFGKKRVLGCECDYSYTCRPCLGYKLPEIDTRLKER